MIYAGFCDGCKRVTDFNPIVGSKHDIQCCICGEIHTESEGLHIDEPTEKETKAAPVGAKDTAGKPRYSLLPRKGCEAVIAVREFGTAKYNGDSENWRKVPQKEWAEAVVRHAMAFLSGEVNDPESGKHHLAHAACSALLGCSVKE